MPFAGYKDFKDCVSKNQDKDDPTAYCGTIKAKVEKEMKEQTYNFTNKRIYTENGSFTEKTDNSGKKILYYESEILPFGKISRNGVKYNEKRAREKGHTLVGKSLFFNHKTSGNASEDLPRGEWEEVWFTKEAMHARARVFQSNYNKDFVDYLGEAKNIKSSLNVSGSAKQRNENGKYHREAFIDEYLEASVVGIPGFDDAKGSLMASMSEAFGDDDMEEAIKPGKYKTKGGETITVHSVSDGKAVISGDDSKNKSIDLDALKAIIGKENLEEEKKDKLIDVSIRQADNGYTVSSMGIDETYVFDKKDIDKALAKVKELIIKKYTYDTNTNQTEPAKTSESMEATMKQIADEIEDLQKKKKDDKFIINHLMKKYKLDKKDVKSLMGEFFESLNEIRENVLENI